MSDQTESERCNACGRPYLTIYRVPDDIWAKVTGRTDGGGTWCPTCFEFVATEKGYSLYWEARHGEFPLEAVKAREETVAKDAARYRILRGTGETQSAYGPEEEGIWGGKDLDDYCDAKLAASSPPGTARPSLGEEGM